jgi:hypothetical protein
VSFRSQQDFRRQLVSALVIKGQGSKICPKRRISQISHTAGQELLSSHKLIRMSKRGFCIACKGLRFRDRPRKRVALSKMASNMGRESTKHSSRLFVSSATCIYVIIIAVLRDFMRRSEN